jgi:hypothetical protein
MALGSLGHIPLIFFPKEEDYIRSFKSPSIHLCQLFWEAQSFLYLDPPWG